MSVCATMCMLPGRYPESLKTVNSLEGQVDKLYLCLNDFWEIPEELKRDWIEVLHLGVNLGDAARFYLLRNLGDVDFDVISCDDDLVYPPTYVNDFLRTELNNSVLTHHGKIIDQGYSIHSVLSIRQKNDRIVNVNIPGSGATFIPKEVFNKLEFTSLVHLNQSDVHLAANFARLGVPVFGLEHSNHYVEYFHPKDGYTIWDTVTSKPDWTDKVKKIFESYGISFQRKT